MKQLLALFVVLLLVGATAASAYTLPQEVYQARAAQESTKTKAEQRIAARGANNKRPKSPAAEAEHNYNVHVTRSPSTHKEIEHIRGPTAFDGFYTMKKQRGPIIGNFVSAIVTGQCKKGEGMTYVITEPPKKGDLKMRNLYDGEFTYVPHHVASGKDAIKFKIVDDCGRSSNVATVEIDLESGGVLNNV